jgi:hypothetical protein
MQHMQFEEYQSYSPIDLQQDDDVQLNHHYQQQQPRHHLGFCSPPPTPGSRYLSGLFASMQQQLQEPSASSTPVLRSPAAPGISSKGGHQGFLDAAAAALAGDSQGHLQDPQQHEQVAAVQQQVPGLDAHGSPTVASEFAAAAESLDDASGASAHSFPGSSSETFEPAADNNMFDQPADISFFFDSAPADIFDQQQLHALHLEHDDDPSGMTRWLLLLGLPHLQDIGYTGIEDLLLPVCAGLDAPAMQLQLPEAALDQPRELDVPDSLQEGAAAGPAEAAGEQDEEEQLMHVRFEDDWHAAQTASTCPADSSPDTSDNSAKPQQEQQAAAAVDDTAPKSPDAATQHPLQQQQQQHVMLHKEAAQAPTLAPEQPASRPCQPQQQQIMLHEQAAQAPTLAPEQPASPHQQQQSQQQQQQQLQHVMLPLKDLMLAPEQPTFSPCQPQQPQQQQQGSSSAGQVLKQLQPVEPAKQAPAAADQLGIDTSRAQLQQQQQLLLQEHIGRDLEHAQVHNQQEQTECQVQPGQQQVVEQSTAQQQQQQQDSCQQDAVTSGMTAAGPSSLQQQPRVEVQGLVAGREVVVESYGRECNLTMPLLPAVGAPAGQTAAWSADDAGVIRVQGLGPVSTAVTDVSDNKGHAAAESLPAAVVSATAGQPPEVANSSGSGIPCKGSVAGELKPQLKLNQQQQQHQLQQQPIAPAALGTRPTATGVELRHAAPTAPGTCLGNAGTGHATAAAATATAVLPAAAMTCCKRCAKAYSMACCSSASSTQQQQA